MTLPIHSFSLNTGRGDPPQFTICIFWGLEPATPHVLTLILTTDPISSSISTMLRSKSSTHLYCPVLASNPRYTVGPTNVDKKMFSRAASFLRGCLALAFASMHPTPIPIVEFSGFFRNFHSHMSEEFVRFVNIHFDFRPLPLG